MTARQFNVWYVQKVDHPIYGLTRKKTSGEQSVNWRITLNIQDTP